MATEIREAGDPIEAWLRWCETATTAWADALGGEGQAVASPLTLYHHWVEAFESAGATPGEGAAQVSPALDDRWQAWSESLTAAWEARVDAAAAVWGLAAHWVEMLSPSQLAARQHTARLAGVVAALEAKVDHLEEGLRGLSGNEARLLDGVRGQGLTLERVDTRLVQVQSALGERAQLTQRLEQVERQLDQVRAASGQMQGALQRLLTTSEKSLAATATETKEAQVEERKGTTKRTTAGSPAPEQA